jgi:hypothetical protein
MIAEGVFSLETVDGPDGEARNLVPNRLLSSYIHAGLPTEVCTRQPSSAGRQIAIREELEAPGHMSHEPINGSGGFRCQENIAREVEQPGHLVPASDGVPSPCLRGCRQVARNHGGDEERHDGNPVLGISNRERANRWEKIEIEGAGRDDGDDRRYPQPSKRGGREYHDQ